MEAKQSSAPREAQQKPSHKTKKRKHGDSEQRVSSKKRKHRNANPGDVLNTPTPTSKSKTKSKKGKHAVYSSSPTPFPAPILSEAEVEVEADDDISLPDATPPTSGGTTPISSPFHLTTLSLYLPLPAIALSRTTALPSLLTTHLAPLLLTYFPPLRGIVLSVSDPVLSSKKPLADRAPQPDVLDDAAPSKTILAHCADTDGVSYVWLTATFLALRPSIGDELEGWVNVCSEGFVGLVCYNYFQVAVARDRIPEAWKWVPPGGGASERKGKKRRGNRRDEGEEEGWAGTSQKTLVNGDGEGEAAIIEAEEMESGYFRREDGTRVRGSVRFRVVDCEIVPGHDRGSWSLQIDGTLLSADEEERVVEEERQKSLRKEGKALMSGGVGSAPGNGSVSGSRMATPT